jgi:hypothetical protein
MRKTWNTGRSGWGDRPLATTLIVAALVACFVVGWALSGSPSNPFWRELAYDPGLGRPWTLLTYPFASAAVHLIWFALAAWVTYQFLSGIERRLGAAGTALFFFALTFLGGLFYFFGALAFGPSAVLPSLNLPLEMVVFAWCLLNPSAQVMLFGLVPMATRVLMWLAAAAVVIEHGWGNPPVGLVTVLPLGLVWLYCTDRIPFLRFGAVPDLAPKRAQRRQTNEFDAYRDDVKRREREREEKERLRRLFENSLSEDDKDQGQR